MSRPVVAFLLVGIRQRGVASSLLPARPPLPDRWRALAGQASMQRSPLQPGAAAVDSEPAAAWV